MRNPWPARLRPHPHGVPSAVATGIRDGSCGTWGKPGIALASGRSPRAAGPLPGRRVGWGRPSIVSLDTPFVDAPLLEGRGAPVPACSEGEDEPEHGEPAHDSAFRDLEGDPQHVEGGRADRVAVHRPGGAHSVTVRFASG